MGRDVTVTPRGHRDWTLFFASDLHGSDRCFKKFLSAARVYGASALLLGGDLVGKELILLRRRHSGACEARLEGRTLRLSTREAVGLFVEEQASRGHYVAEVDDPESLGPGDRSALFDRLAEERLRGWTELARERLSGTGVEVLVIPGNDDPEWVDPLLGTVPFVNVDQKVLTVGPDLQVLGLGCSTPTPWDTHREWSEARIEARLGELLSTVDGDRPLIFHVHVPPYGSGLDDCPALDAELRPRVGAGGVLMAPVGSQAVADAIREHEPVLGLFGHVHEGRGAVHVAKTLCVNPGSDFGHGRLFGAIAVLRDGHVADWILTEG